MADDSVVHAEVPVAASVLSRKNASLDEIVAIAEKIWGQIGASYIGKKDKAGNDSLLAQLQRTEQDFAKSFPLILRWMVQMRRFRSDAFRLFLVKHAVAPLKTREEFLTLQAEYLVLLEKADNPRYDNTRLNSYRRTVITHLLNEDKEFKKIEDDVQADLDRKAKLFKEDRRRKLLEHFQAEKARREAPPAVSPPAQVS